MGLNKSKKLAKKSIKPSPVVEEAEETEEQIDDDDVEEIDEEEVEEVPVKAKRGRPAKKAAKPVPVVDDSDDEDDSDEDDEDDSAEGFDFDADSVVKDIVSDKRNLTSAVYQVQLRLPAELEPIYKALTPRLKKALRDAFGELIKKAYEQTH